MKTAIITGVAGQDGSYLAELLLSKGYHVVGTYSNYSSIETNSRIHHIKDKIKLEKADLKSESSFIRLIDKYEPNEIYNLGSISFVSTSFKDPLEVLDVTGLGVLRLLEAIKKVNREVKLYQASSSEMFGLAMETPQNENTHFHPRSPYGIAKVLGHNAVVNYRESYGIFACSGILFNHESPRRGVEFVTRKISTGAAKIKLGLSNELKLGNLDAKRDWGFAGDYVEAMWLMLQQPNPQDFVIATGETHSVRNFCEVAFSRIGLDYNQYVKVDEKFYRPADVNLLQGDFSKAKNILGWQPKVGFKQLVEMMVDADLNSLKSA